MRLDIIITRLVYFCVLGLTLAACGSNKSAPIEDRVVITQAEVDERIGGQLIRIVQPGDTLYSIAFALNLDAKKIALWNDITDTSKLLVGKRIRLTEPIGFQYLEKPEPLSASKTLAAKTDRRIPAKTSALEAEAEGRTKKSALNAKPSQQSQPPKSLASKPVTSDQEALKPRTLDLGTSNSAVNWQWPMRGTLVGRFNLSKGQQGINIQGQRGQAVFTAAPGEVVYAGDSLRGYGNLVIVKHSNDYLSAYAHNQEILVKEGDTLDAGQQLARLGYNLTGAPVSQFQIRKNGVPVDPLRYLEGA